ncbi:type IV pilus modification PilV family protein [Paraglaciecola arctica]|uniref:MSHA pilin protein MshD n=1 Tax=Paraglaciecola arctica BSs20135 TaxID=493475 RepID=K6Z580_9ALTE|nr:type II secretion system protein [Paraglaciecola arctica]GAC18590.1 MSHA pilin protein MshD [Paraglaciecola arctica BSs20135]|tara:strand:+ start:573 stop:1148 length:576 start_codon:yes stop_codon:yes gene_type:complete
MLVNKAKGFTLIELVIGMVVFSIALVLFTSLIVPQAIRSVDPIFQVRATELGQSLINEIVSKSFDEASDRVGGSVLCSNTVAPLCTTSNNLGAEEGAVNRENFDDVDDYNNLSESDENIKNTLNESVTLGGVNLYQGFSAAVVVIYDDNMDGIDDAISGGGGYIGRTKLVTVTITTPNDEEIIFSTFRSNY